MTNPTTLIDALNGTFGRHKGFRASHAKGLAVQGRFIPTPDTPSAEIPLLRSERPVSARLSVGGGKPDMSDKSPSVRGIGLAIGNKNQGWSMALISAPVFFANSADQFVAFLNARKPDPEIGGPNPELVKAFNEANPNTMPHQEYLKTTSPCACYSSENYHSGHAYGVAGSGGNVSARLFLEPEAGRIGLTEAEMSSHSGDFLFDTLRAKLADGPVRWSLKLIVANPGDALDDPTVPWRGTHQEVTLGTIEIIKLDDTDAGQKRVYDPTHLPVGIALPQDNVFALRSPAYAVSAARRSD